jgi:SAM-dependent methyltransferase
VLAKELDAHITAIDFAELFVGKLRERVAEAGLSDRIEATVGQMESLSFRDEQFDVIWSEGAIYNMGFTEGLRAWRRFLRPGGIMAVSEITWTTAERPAAIDEHWNAEYPGIATASEKMRIIEDEGYEPVGFFFLPGRLLGRELLRAAPFIVLRIHGTARQLRRRPRDHRCGGGGDRSVS